MPSPTGIKVLYQLLDSILDDQICRLMICKLTDITVIVLVKRVQCEKC